MIFWQFIVAMFWPLDQHFRILLLSSQVPHTVVVRKRNSNLVQGCLASSPCSAFHPGYCFQSCRKSFVSSFHYVLSRGVTGRVFGTGTNSFDTRFHPN